MLDPTKTKPLDDYWEANKLSEETPTDLPDSRSSSSQQSEHDHTQSQASPTLKGPGRNRAISSASMLGSPGQGVSPHHPALSLPRLLDTFGPLIFPLYKAALLRKRILMVTQAPVELSCDFGMKISVRPQSLLANDLQFTMFQYFPIFRLPSPTFYLSSPSPLDFDLFSPLAFTILMP